MKTKGDYTYYDQGEGPVILLLHGLFGSLSNFQELINLLKKDYRVVMPVLPIYTCDVKMANLNGLLEYIKKFVDMMNLDDFSILGNSLGGHLALLYELHYPAETKSLVLTGSSGLFENSLGTNYPKKDKEFIKVKVAETFGNKALATDNLINEVYDVVTNPKKLIRIVKIAKSATRQNLNYELQNIHKPTLLIWGQDDTITPPFVAEQFHDKIKDSELDFIPNCGHAPMMEYPHLFYHYLHQFLNKIYPHGK